MDTKGYLSERIGLKPLKLKGLRDICRAFCSYSVYLYTDIFLGRGFRLSEYHTGRFTALLDPRVNAWVRTETARLLTAEPVAVLAVASCSWLP